MKSFLRILLLVVILSGISACAAEELKPENQPSLAAVQAPVALNADEQKTLNAINVFRRKAGVAPLAMDSRMVRAARNFSQEMKETQNFKTFSDRISLLLLDEKVPDPYPRTFVAEATLLDDILNDLQTKQQKVMTEPGLNFAGIGIIRSADEFFLTLILVDRNVEIEPFSWSLQPGETLSFSGRVLAGYRNPKLEVTVPSGMVVSHPVTSEKDRFRVELPMQGEGEYILEVIVEGELGPKVAAIIPVTVGAPGKKFSTRSLKSGQYLTTEEAEKAMVALINQDRHVRRLPELTEDETLATIARNHSADMAKNDYFGHTSPYYGDLKERVRPYYLNYSSMGENISLDDTIEHAEEELLKSPGHRKNLLGDFTHVGVGIVMKEGKLYITQVFMKKRD